MGWTPLPDLGSGDVLTAAWVDAVEANMAALSGLAVPVTSLPPSPDPGDVVRYKPLGGGSSPVWLCTWDPLLNGGTGAWSVAGPPLTARVAAGQTMSGTAWGNLSTVGPSVPLPAAGVYDIEWEATLIGGATNTMALASPSLPGVNAQDVNSSRWQAYTGSSQGHMRGRRRGTATAGTATLMYRTNGTGTATFSERHLWMHPVELRP